MSGNDPRTVLRDRAARLRDDVRVAQERRDQAAAEIVVLDDVIRQGTADADRLDAAARLLHGPTHPFTVGPILNVDPAHVAGLLRDGARRLQQQGRL